MKAAQINAYGDADVLKINPNAPKPSPEAGKVVVQVKAAGVNPIDWKLRRGVMAKAMPLPFPSTLGFDFSGEVAAVGEGVTEFAVGDEVYGQAGPLGGGTGTFAEFALAPVQIIARKPKNFDHNQAAGLPLVGVSAIMALDEHIHLQKGQKLLVHGAAGGIGTFAVQLAKHLGAYVAATASAQDSEYVKSLGADDVIDYQSQKFEDIVKDFDAVFDPVGGETYSRSFAVLKPGGILVSMVAAVDEQLAKKFGVTAIYQSSQANRARLEKLTALAERGVVKMHIDKVFPLDQAAEALAYLETGKPRGKVVIAV